MIEKLNNMDQVMEIEKVSKFNFSNEEAEEFISRWSQRLVNARSTSHLKQKIFYIVFET